MKSVHTLRTDPRVPWRRSDRQEDRQDSLLSSSRGWPEDLSLSPRECEIARLVARDRTNREIAAILDISEWTVATHLRRIFAKLGVHSKAAMVACILDRVAERATRPSPDMDEPAD